MGNNSMKFTKMHMFLIICFAAIISIMMFFLLPIWACSLAGFISIISLIYMLNDFFEERSSKRAELAGIEDDSGAVHPIDESYPDWERPEGEQLLKEPAGKMKLSSHKEKMIDHYMNFYNLDRTRSAHLYDAGYKNMTRLRHAKLEDLVKIQGINPTVARRIQSLTRSAGDRRD